MPRNKDNLGSGMNRMQFEGGAYRTPSASYRSRAHPYGRSRPHYSARGRTAVPTGRSRGRPFSSSRSEYPPDMSFDGSLLELFSRGDDSPSMPTRLSRAASNNASRAEYGYDSRDTAPHGGSRFDSFSGTRASVAHQFDDDLDDLINSFERVMSDHLASRYRALYEPSYRGSVRALGYGHHGTRAIPRSARPGTIYDSRQRFSRQSPSSHRSYAMGQTGGDRTRGDYTNASRMSTADTDSTCTETGAPEW